MKKIPNARVAKSLEWIKLHPFASNLDVPDELLEEWLVVPGPDQNEPAKTGLPSDFHMTVFLFGLMQQKMLDNPTAVSRETAVSFELSDAELMGVFDKWQMKLAMAEVHKNSEYALSPLPLFRFPEEEKIQVLTRQVRKI